jgi:hypothetical protein
MSDKQDSGSSQQVNEVKKAVTFEALENSVTFNIDLRPGHNRLIVRARGEFLFSV